MPGKRAAFVAAAASAVVASANVNIDIAVNMSALGQAYEGIGALSGGGGVTRMLIDYEPAIQQQLLDILFKPGYGASLQMIKVEIGGDTQSTEGTEASHMHTRDDLNCSRGYEWMVLAEAKKRNPAIKTFGLTWGVPGWIGGGNFWSEDNLRYHLTWLDCARNTWGVEVDYMGIWNERYSGAPDALDWIKQLRTALDEGGYETTRIVASDNGWNIAEDMSADPALSAAIDVIGAHYPNNVDPVAVGLHNAQGKSLWASEMWDLSKVNDWPGALRLAQNLGQHGVWGLSMSIVWCLIYSWMAPLPFSTTGATTAGLGHALLTAAEPWSGHWELSPTVAAVAHHTQFAAPDWVYAAFGSGTGYLDAGNTSTYVTIINPNIPLGSTPELSVILETAAQSQPLSVSISIGGLANGASLPPALHVWATTGPQSMMVQQPDLPVGPNGLVSLTLAPGAMYSLTTTTGQSFPAPAPGSIAPSAPFPFPYSDSFDGYAEGAYPKYTADEGGLFVAAQLPAWAGKAGGALLQNITAQPIAWEPNPAPYTFLGNFNPPGPLGGWANYSVAITAAIDPSSEPSGGTLWQSSMQQCAAASGSQSFKVVGGDGVSLAQPALLESVAHPGLCLGLAGTLDANASNAPVVGLAPCPAAVTDSATGKLTAPVAYQWQQVAGSPHIVNVGTGNCLDVGGGSTSPGAEAVNWECKPAGQDQNQRWTVQPGSAAGTVTLVSDLTGLCIDLTSTQLPSPYVMLCSRVHVYVRGGPPPSGYCLSVFASPNATAPSSWTLAFGTKTLASGSTPAPVVPGAWLPLKVTVAGDAVSGSLGGAQLFAGVPGQGLSSYGMIAFGSGWGYPTWWDDLAITA